MSLTVGKWRRLQQTSSERGTFSILAVDHRGPLRRELQKEFSGEVSDHVLTDLKLDIVRSLGAAASAVLLDPETGAGPCIASGAIRGETGLVMALDSGSTGDPGVIGTGLVDGWSVEKTVRIGAAGVKLLMYYHPELPEAEQNEQLVRSIGQACAQHDMPFFLEPISCSPDEKRGPLPSAQRQQVGVEAARRLVPLGVDILKAEFPVDVTEEPDQRRWREACEQLTDACPAPWVLLSAGVSYDTFLRQTRIACEAGASGVMVGRAVWKEAVTSDATARNGFLNRVGRERMSRLRSLCDALARPFTEVLDRPSTEPDWYKY